MAATLDSVTEQIKAGNTASEARDKSNMKISTMTLEVLQSMLDLSLDDSAAARERAREAARSATDPIKNASPQAKTEEVKAKGFFSKLGRAVTSPIGAMGRSMKSAGKGIGGFLKGLSSGLASFANPMVLLGVTTMAISLPIMAAGLAAAFKVFEMIAGEGKALEFVTGIIESLGEAIGTILQKVLEGFGTMVKNMGPFITRFFEGMAVVIEALEPIVVSIFKIIKDIITDPVLNTTIQAVLKTVEVLIVEIGKVIETVGNVVISVMENIGTIIEKIGNAIQGIITAVGDSVTKVVGSVSDLITAIGNTVATVINSIVGGIERLTALPAGNMAKVALGLTAMAGALVLFSAGAAIAGAFMPTAADLDKIANSVTKFANLEPGNLAGVGEGMKKVGLGLAAFGVGGAIADLLMPTNSAGMDAVASSVQKFGGIDATNFGMVGDGIKKLGIGLAAFGGGGVISSLGEAFSSWIGGDKDPVEKFQKFAAIGPGLKQAGDGVTALAKSFDAFNTDNLERIGDGLDNFMGKVDMNKLTAFSAATEGLMTGQMLAQLQIQANQEGSKTAGGSTYNVNNQNMQTNQSSAVMLPPDPVSPGDNDVMNVRIVS